MSNFKFIVIINNIFSCFTEKGEEEKHKPDRSKGKGQTNPRQKCCR